MAMGEGISGRGRLYALIAAVTLLWGLNWPMMKVGVSEFQPWTFRVISVWGAAPVLLLLGRSLNQPMRPPTDRLPALLAISIVGVTGWHMLTAYGLQMIGGGRAAIIAYTMPMWASLFAVLFLGERASGRSMVGLLLGMSGMAVLIGPELTRFGDQPLGALLILIAAFTWAVQTVLTKAVDWRIGTIALSGWQLAIGGIPIALVWLVLELPPDLSAVTWRGVLAMLYIVFVALVFCFTSFLLIVRLLPAIAAALSTLAIPVVGVASSAWLLGEPIGWREIAALLLVLSAMTLVLWPRRQPA